MKNLERRFTESTGKIFDLAGKAVPYVYKDGNGDYVTEKIGTYCAFITRDMIREMGSLSLLLASPYPEFSKKVKEAADIMNKKDLTICRMLDDMKAERELSLYEFSDTEGAVLALEELYRNKAFDKAPFDFFKPKMKEWCKRFLMLDVRAYYIKSKDYLKSALKLASMRAFDDDGNLVFGISEQEEKTVQIMAKMEKMLLNALIKLPVHADELSECMKKVEVLECLIESIISNKDEAIAYLLKCMEAAKDFEDIED